MRSRQEINDSMDKYDGIAQTKLIIEVLLDIRDLLQQADGREVKND